MVVGRERLVSAIAATLLLVLVAIGITLLVYLLLANRSILPGPPLKPGGVIVEAVKAGLGYIKIYVRSVGVDAYIDTIYFYDGAGGLIAAYTLPNPVKLEPGSLAVLNVSLLYLNAHLLEGPLGDDIIERLASARIIGLGVVGTYAVLRARLPVRSFLVSLERASQVEFGILVDPSLSYSDPREVVLSPPSYRYIVLNPVLGYWVMFYLKGGRLDRIEGTLVVLRTPVLNLSAMSWGERYALGPVVVFVNPYRGAKRYVVKIVTVYGGAYSFTLEPLPEPSHIVLDLIVAWEDEWYPGTGQLLDNWADHVFRVTLYDNGTVRVEALRYSGTWLHMVFAKAPAIDTLRDMLHAYDSNGYRLPASSGIAYVKVHTSRHVNLTETIWDPVSGEYITTWPVTVYRRI